MVQTAIVMLLMRYIVFLFLLHVFLLLDGQTCCEVFQCNKSVWCSIFIFFSTFWLLSLFIRSCRDDARRSTQEKKSFFVVIVVDVVHPYKMMQNSRWRKALSNPRVMCHYSLIPSLWTFHGTHLHGTTILGLKQSCKSL